MIERILIGLALMGIPLFAARHAFRKMLAEERARSRTPFTEKLLRPAGESLRLKIEGIGDEIMEKGMALSFLIVFPATLVMLSPLQTTSVKLFAYLSLPALCWAAAVVQWRKLVALRDSLRNHRLGFDGERYIGTELDLLRAEGFRVYHDFVFDMKPGGEATTFNIDHIAVGPAGVFAIETKTRRKPVEAPEGEQKRHEVLFDGKALVFPSGFRDTSSIDQARSNASDLREWLAGSSSEPVPVTPVLVIPGWFVERRGASDVRVLSGKELVTTLRSMKGGFLPPARIAALADRIEAHCRNIDAV